jgi:hypothetical protein
MNLNISFVTMLVVGVLIMSLSGATPAWAHHSFAAFNMTAEQSVTGVVKQVQWTNPHIWIWLEVPNGKGGTDVFSFEGMSPNFLERRNWTKNTLKAGDTITIIYRPLISGAHGGMFVSGKTAEGKILTMQGGQASQGSK